MRKFSHFWVFSKGVALYILGEKCEKLWSSIILPKIDFQLICCLISQFWCIKTESFSWENSFIFWLFFKGVPLFVLVKKCQKIWSEIKLPNIDFQFIFGLISQFWCIKTETFHKIFKPCLTIFQTGTSLHFGRKIIKKQS